MPWFKVDDGLHSHPKAIEAGLEAMGLWVLLGSFCGFYVGQRGRVSRATAIRIAGSARTMQRCATRLVKAGFWEPDGDGWLFHDWDVYQPTPESIEAEQLRKSLAGKAGAAARANAKAAAEHDSSTMPTQSEHDLSTKRARLEHDLSTTSTRREHEASTEATRPSGSSSRNDSIPPQQPLTTCSTDKSAADIARPVPSRPVPVNGSDPPGVREPEAPELPSWFLSAVGTVEMTTGIEIDRASAWLRYEGHRAQKGIAPSAGDARYWLTTVFGREASQDRDRRRQREDAGERPAKGPIAPLPPAEPEREYPPPTAEEAAALTQALRDLVEPPAEAKSGVRAALGADLTPAELEKLETKRRETIAALRAETAAAGAVSR